MKPARRVSLQNMSHLLWPTFLFLEQYCKDIKNKVDQACISVTHLYFSVFDVFFSPSGKSYKPDKPSLDVSLKSVYVTGFTRCTEFRT